MQRRTLRLVLLGIETIEEAEHAGRRDSNRIPERLDALDAVDRRQDLVRNVQAHLRNRSAAAQHDVRRIRVDEDIELGRGRAIAALAHRPTHEHDLLDLRHDRRLAFDRGGDIGQRPGRHKRDRAVVGCEQRAHDEIDRVLVLQRRLGFEHVDAVDARLAVNRLGRLQRPSQRRPAPCEDRHVSVPRDVAHHACVAMRQFERHVAAHRRDPENFHILGRREREQQRDGVVLPGIAVDDDLARHKFRT